MTGSKNATDRSAASVHKIPPIAVLIIGGGPVGSSQGMDLASRGIQTLIVQQRAAMKAPNPRGNQVRPDQHVAWRSTTVPANVEELVAQIRGGN